MASSLLFVQNDLTRVSIVDEYVTCKLIMFINITPSVWEVIKTTACFIA